MSDNFADELGRYFAEQLERTEPSLVQTIKDALAAGVGEDEIIAAAKASAPDCWFNMALACVVAWYKPRVVRDEVYMQVLEVVRNVDELLERGMVYVDTAGQPLVELDEVMLALADGRL